jgi:stage II sporulation protein D
MKRIILIILFLTFLIVILVPLFMIRGVALLPSIRPQKGIMIQVYVMATGNTVKMDSEEYLKGVVAAEMPASFELEALKAQAVAARTYLMKRARVYGGPGCSLSPEADICTDPAHDQAWISAIDFKKKHGFWDYLRYWNKISKAVNDTRGLVVTYQGQLIDALFHSTSGGITENSEDVWGSSVPYLRSVVSDWEGHSPFLYDAKEFGIGDLATLLNTTIEPGAGVIRALATSQTGRVKVLKVGERLVEGVELRRILGLRSTRFAWQIVGDSVRFTTIGYGHGVGMSQYGADGLARRGKNFREILEYYYPGAKVTSISG